MTCDVPLWTQNGVKYQNMQYLYKNWVYRVENLHDWSATRTTHCGSCYDVTTETYSLFDLYLPKMTDASFVAPKFNGLPFISAVWFSYLPTPNEWTTRANNTSWRRKTLFSLLNEEGLELIVLPRKCHIMELCDNCNNFTRFQFHADKVFRNIPFFVTLNHFMSNIWRLKSFNLICMNQNLA